MVWVDAHCHLQLDPRPADELLDRAEDVAWVVVPGVDSGSSRQARDLAGAHPGRVEWTAGVHPHDADRWAEEAATIEALAPGAAAVGETGLDYYRLLSPRSSQVQAFEAQLTIAAELGKPVVVHCRDAFADMFELLERAALGAAVVLHCWTGGRKWTRRFLDLGVTFSFAGPLAFETGETIRLAAELVPPERAMVETDTPFLTPPPHRGEPNEPAWVARVGEVLASVWGATVDEVAASTTDVATRTFR